MAVVADYAQLPLLAPEQRWHPPAQLPSLSGAKRISIDVETCDPTLSTLGPGVRRGGYVAGLAVGVEGGGRWYLPVRHATGENLDEKAVWRWARSELNAFTGEVVGANLVYDLDYLAESRVTFPHVTRFLDVQVAEPLLDEQRNSYSLDELSKDYLGEQKVEETLREAALAYGFGTAPKDVKRNLWRLPPAYVGAYAEGDVDLPLRILRLQEKKLEAEDLTSLFELESDLIPIVLAMRRRGVRVNVNRADEVLVKLSVERDAALAELRHLAGSRAELMAPESFAPALSERGLRFPLTGKTKKPSITKDWLKANAGDALVDAITRGRRVDYTINTFIMGHVKRHSINGRIHCEFVQLRDDEGGTIGRFASRNPNLQNVPSRDEEIGPLVRGLFEPEEGEDWERQDQAQAEYRLQVHYARGEGAAEARERYRNDPNTDFHKMCAEFLGADPEDKVIRKKVKNTNFAKSYGALAPKLAITFGCSVPEAEDFIKLYEEKLPFTKTTFDAADKAARKNGFVRSVLGRYARYKLWEPTENGRTKRALRKPALPRDKALLEYGAGIVRANTYTALNRVLQLSNADVTKKAMCDIWKAGICDVLGAFLLQVHDELDYSVPRTKVADEAAAEARRLTEIAVPLKVPFLVAADRGPNWGACK